MKDLHHRRRQQRNRNPAVRALVVIGGSVLALEGAAMTVLPGPKLPAAALGFYLLAFEFGWAERLVDWALRKTEAAKRKYERAGPVRKYGGLVWRSSRSPGSQWPFVYSSAVRISPLPTDAIVSRANH
jgi:hypothetical protein